MLSGKPLSYQTILKASAAGLLIFFFSSCAIVVPKNYPRNKPFVYEYKINLDGNFTSEERNELIAKLENQLDDSIHIRKIPQLYRQVLKKPPVYNSANTDRSVIFMRGLLKSLGYFHDTIAYTTVVDTAGKEQLRTLVKFTVRPGKQVKIDSIRYSINHPELQHLTDSANKGIFIKKGDPFAIAPISNELDRLVDLYRNNGYLRFTKEELKVFWDTLEVSMLDPTLDPFEQLEMLQKLKEQRENPVVRLEVRLSPNFDNSKLVKYFVGNVSVYPDYNQDTAGYTRKEIRDHDIKVVYYRNLFKPKILVPNVYLHHGELYSQKNYFRTINRFNSLGAWGLTNIERLMRNEQDTVDFKILLSPAKKFTINTSLEGSRNQSAISGNLFGMAVNVGLLNRNFAKSVIQTNTNARFGIELGNNAGEQFIQTQQVSLSHVIYFPRTIPDIKFIPAKLRENSRTVFTFNVANTERRDLYNLTTVNGSWGYEFQWGKKFISIRIPNIEYSYLTPRQKLLDLWTSNPSLKNIFTDGFISSTVTSFNISGGKKNNINNFNTNLEESGLLTGMMRNKFLDSNLYRFVKLDGEFTRKIQYKKSSIALRFFAGIGYELNSTVNPQKKNSLPFFKQYFSGGPNSMRAWGIRKLGPGSVIKPFSGTGAIPDRYGDVQLEANFEYRFPLFAVAGIKLNGAAFTDIGNVWLLKKNAGLPEEIFSVSRLWKDIAIGTGVGLRVDFSFFVIRFDYAYKVKDPSPTPSDATLQNKWFGYKFPKGTQFQLGISYPFIL